MAFLDFIKNRQTEQRSAGQPSQQQKPETAKEMYAQQAAQEKTAPKALDQMAPEQWAKVEDIKAKMKQATQYLRQNEQPASPDRADGATGPQPMAQKMTSQDKAAPALSPTSAQAGTRATEQEAPGPSGESQAKAQEKSQGRPQTIARRPPSWER